MQLPFRYSPRIPFGGELVQGVQKESEKINPGKKTEKQRGKFLVPSQPPHAAAATNSNGHEQRDRPQSFSSHINALLLP